MKASRRSRRSSDYNEKGEVWDLQWKVEGQVKELLYSSKF